MKRYFFVVLTVVGALTILTPPAAATTCDTIINAVPFTISTKGNYCLGQDFTVTLSSGNAITILDSPVTLDFNGHFIANNAVGPGTAIGVKDNAEATIRNGVIEGFYIAIHINTAAASVVEDMYIWGAKFTGIVDTSQFGSIIRNNRMRGVGGAADQLQPNAPGFGIYLVGRYTKVLNNDIVSVIATGTGLSAAVFVAGTASHVIEGNRLSAAQYGLYIGPTYFASYRNNTATAVSFPFFGGTDMGGNHADNQ